MYKILSKLLANRVSKVLQKVISPTQTRFLPNRNISEGILIANELVDEVKRSNSSCVIFKANIEKAFDSVSWEYLFVMMRNMGFHDIWIGWIRECLRTARIAILVNGSPTNGISMARALRQGDPLSPLLFLIVAEGLNALIEAAKQAGLFKGAAVGNEKIIITHLQYADDILLIEGAYYSGIRAMKMIMRYFEAISGLKINFSKSSLIGVNVDEGWLSQMVNFLHCNVSDLPFKYLGLLVGANPRRCDTWNPVIEFVKKKLKVWSPKLLSFSARMILVKSVLSSLPTYLFSLFKAPKNVIKKLTSLQLNFMWGGDGESRKISWVSWDTICRDKVNGGLGVRKLEDFNVAMLGK